MQQPLSDINSPLWQLCLDCNSLIVSPNDRWADVIQLWDRSNSPLHHFDLDEGIATTALIPSSLLVMAGSQLLGIVTAPAILLLSMHQQRFVEITVADVMTTPAIILKQSEIHDLSTILQLMQHHRSQCIPVMDAQDQVLGVITQERLLQLLHPLVLQLESQPVDRTLTQALQLQEQVEQKDVLVAIATRIRQSLRLQDIFQTTVTEIRQLLQTDRVVIYQFAPDYSGTIVAESVGTGWRLSLGQQIDDTCFQTNGVGEEYRQGRKRAIANIYTADLTDCHRQLLEQFEVKANLVVPILVGSQPGQEGHGAAGTSHSSSVIGSSATLLPFHHPTPNPWGLLVAHHCISPREWKSSELEILDQLGVQIAIAIQQADTYEKLQQLNVDLERRVQERTAALDQTNQQLQAKLLEQQSNEEALRRSEEQLKASLREKEVLMKEIHHRVKNNLQMISSLLNLQASSITDPKILEPFIESQRRIKSMAMVHERLYRSGNLGRIRFNDYVYELAEDLFRSYIKSASDITLRVEVAEVDLDIDTAITCGLIINELISNSIKYAFPGDRSGKIGIQFNRDLEHQYCLVVYDTGVGIPDTIDLRTIDSLGLQLVQALAHHLRGTVELDRSPGTLFKVVFSKPE